MKRLAILAAVVAMLTLSMGVTAEAGKGKGKQNNYASQSSGNSQFQSQPQWQPTQQNSQYYGQISQSQSNQLSQSYQGSTIGKQNNYQQTSKLRLKPSVPASQTGLSKLPKFGFDSTFGWHNSWLGEQVTHVNFSGPASRLGLEPGDAIIAVNGQDLQTANCWHNALNRAANHDGWVTLKILDGRSGKMAYRTANLFQLNVK